jgi:hypothetical protein
MTPEERAEKITSSDDWDDIASFGIDYERLAKMIAAAIREAVLEDRQARTADDIYRLARAGAYEDAEKIAQRFQRRRNSHRFLAEHIAKVIRARAKEVCK